MVQQEQQDQQDLMVTKVSQDQQDKPGNQETVVHPAHREQPVPLVRRDLSVILDQPVIRDNRERQEMQGPQDSRERPERLVPREVQGVQDSRDRRVSLELKGHLETKETLVIREVLGRLGSPGQLDNQDSRGRQEGQDPRVVLEHPGLLGLEERQGLRVSPAILVHQVSPDKVVPLETKVYPGLKGPVEPLDQQEDLAQ